MKRKHTFSLVEILLALGVCAIGICSVMVLFPIGANASKDASMETFAAHCAEQMLDYQAYMLKQDWTNKNAIPTTNNDDSEADVDSTSTWSQLNSNLGPNIFRCGTDGVFQLVGYYGNNSTYSIDDDKIDNRVIVKVRQDTVTMKDKNDATLNINPDFGIRLLVEASWPAELPYAQRQKSVYSLDVFRGNN